MFKGVSFSIFNRSRSGAKQESGTKSSAAENHILAERVDLIEPFFCVDFYKSFYEDLQFEEDSAYFQHYIEHGLVENRSPNVLLSHDEFHFRGISLNEWIRNPKFEIIESRIWQIYRDKFNPEANGENDFLYLLNIMKSWRLHSREEALMFMAVFAPMGSLELAEQGKLPSYFDWRDDQSDSDEVRRFKRWHQSFDQQAVSCISIFDDAFYRHTYADISGLDNVLYHFLVHGEPEGRLPSPFFDSYFYSRENEEKGLLALFSKKKNRSPSYLGAVTSFCHRHYSNTEKDFVLSVVKRLSKLFNGRFNSDAQYSLFMHMLNPYYIRCLDSAFPSDPLDIVEAWVHSGCSTAFSPLFMPSKVNLEKRDWIDEYLNWYEEGRPNQNVETPIFNEEYYRKKHLDLKAWADWGYLHYLQYGQYENRQAIPLFDPTWIAHTYDTRGLSALDFYLKCEIEENSIKPSPAMMPINQGIQRNDQRWQVAGILSIANDCLQNEILNLGSDSELTRMLQSAAKIDPQIKVFEAGRFYSVMPFSSDLYSYIRDLKSRVGYKQTLIFRDGINFGGADVVLKHCYNAVKEQSENVAIISTGEVDWKVVESHGIEPEDVIDLSDITGFKHQYLSAHIVYDIIIGSGCNTVYNLNSGALWKTIEDFGKVLCKRVVLYGFLFCDDRDAYGNVAGYPEKYFLNTIRYLEKLYLDSYALKQELAARISCSRDVSKKLAVFNTPIENAISSTVSYVKNLSGSRNKVAWAGRFDEQKRPDLLKAIALAMPGVTFYVWGKAVLSTTDYRLEDIPNIKLMGLYKHITEITETQCDLYLYTSEWDGVPTVLLTMQEQGLPIVASNVGGVSEVLPDVALVNGFEPADYVERIQDYLDNLVSVANAFDGYKQVSLSDRTYEGFRSVLAMERV